MGFFDIFNSITGGLGSLGSLVSGIGSIIQGNNAVKSAERQTQMAVEAQKEMNAQNIASQEKINQANIDNTNYINSLMRHDANNAIGIKKQDLINSGYSTADPSLSGASTASLSSPQLNAPQVQSEFPESIAGLVPNAELGLSSALLNSSNAFADLAVKRAQARELDSRASGQEKLNGWIDAQQQVNLDTSLQNLVLMGQQEKINAKEIEKYSYDFKLLNNQIKLAFENVETQRLTNAELTQTFNSRIQKVFADLDDVRQNIAESKSRVSLNSKNKKKIDAEIGKIKAETRLKELESDFQEINNEFAKYGLNLNGSDIVNTLGRLATSPDGKKVLPMALDFVAQSISGILDKLF